MSTVVLYVQPQGGGWGPITAMARLAARLLDADLVTLDDAPRPWWTRVAALGPRLRGADALLVVAANPEHLAWAATVPGIRHRFGTVVGWVIDCWWTDRIPLAVVRGHLYDRLLVTEQEVVGEWARRSGLPVEWLPLGADVLAAVDRTRAVQGRTVDLQRVGRQAPAWEGDDVISTLCRQRGLSYGARPPFGDTPDRSYANVLDAYGRAKAVLAFTNLASPAAYTHPTREYVTSRWLDALAHGALVAGRRPREQGSDRLLWDGATLEVPEDDPASGLDLLATTLADWTPEAARDLQREALKRLDWRLRLRSVAEILGVHACPLDAETARLRQIQASFQE